MRWTRRFSSCLRRTVNQPPGRRRPSITRCGNAAARDGLRAMRALLGNCVQPTSCTCAVADRRWLRARTLDGVIAKFDRRLASMEQERAGRWCLGSFGNAAPGVGLSTPAWPLVSTLSVSLSATLEQAAANAGMAPLPWESGPSMCGRAQLGHAALGGCVRRCTSLAYQRHGTAQRLTWFVSACGRQANR